MLGVEASWDLDRSASFLKHDSSHIAITQNGSPRDLRIQLFVWCIYFDREARNDIENSNHVLNSSSLAPYQLILANLTTTPLTSTIFLPAVLNGGTRLSFLLSKWKSPGNVGIIITSPSWDLHGQAYKYKTVSPPTSSRATLFLVPNLIRSMGKQLGKVMWKREKGQRNGKGALHIHLYSYFE